MTPCELHPFIKWFAVLNIDDVPLFIDREYPARVMTTNLLRLGTGEPFLPCTEPNTDPEGSDES
jgi:hypothetical protein